MTVTNFVPNTAAIDKGHRLSANGFPIVTVNDKSVDKYTTTVTAYDSCSKLDKEFDNSAFETETTDPQTGKKVPRYYSESDVRAAVSLQLGGLSIGSPNGQSRYQKDDLSGTCRSILEKMAEVNGIVWADTLGSITPEPFRTGWAGSLAVSNSAEVTGLHTDTTAAVVLTDTNNGVRYPAGLLSGTVFKFVESEQVKGNAAVYTALAGRLENKAYSSLKVTNAIVSGNFAVPAQVTIGANTYTVLDLSVRLTAAGLLCDMSAPELLNDADTYKPKQTREDKKSVKKGEKVGCFFLNENYSGVKIEVTASS